MYTATIHLRSLYVKKCQVEHKMFDGGVLHLALMPSRDFDIRPDSFFIHITRRIRIGNSYRIIRTAFADYSTAYHALQARRLSFLFFRSLLFL